MDIKLSLSAQQIVDKEFQAIKAGYDPLAVDQFLDKVAADYLQMEKYVKNCEEEFIELASTNKVYKKQLEELEIQNEINKEKLKGISEDDAVSYSNIDLIKRINALENALHKCGVDPTTIK